MGIDSFTIKLMAKMMRDKNLSGSCITFGVQGIQGQYSDIVRILEEEKYRYSEIDKNEIIFDDITQCGKTVHQSVLFKLMGFTHVDSLDYYPNEKPTYLVNLNESINKEFHNRYDLVYDGGTSEHCFNIKEVMTNVVRLLKMGGRVIHHLPVSGCINHGFYQFSPTFFFDFYQANGFTELEAVINVHKNGVAPYYFRYAPKLMPYDFKGKTALIFFTARKNSENSEVVVPMQGMYLSKFEHKDNESTEDKRYGPSPFVSNMKKIMKILPENLNEKAARIYWTYRRYREKEPL